MALLEQYGAWNRDRITKKLDKVPPDITWLWFPYSDTGKTEVGTKEYILKLLNKTPDEKLGRRVLKLQTAVSAWILAITLIGSGSLIENKPEILASNTTSSVKTTK